MSEELQERWIITTQMRTDTGRIIEYLFTGTEREAQRIALHYNGRLRRETNETEK